MDYNRIKMIKSYADQIRKFRNLDKFKNMNEDNFKDETVRCASSFSLIIATCIWSAPVV